MFFPEKFLKKGESERIVESIKKAESLTSGEIRVHFQKKLKTDLMQEAAYAFHSLRMDETAERNGVLIFVAPMQKKFCILGDTGIDQVVPDNFWEDVKNEMTVQFKAGNMAEGICLCIEKIGEKLKKHFPYQKDDINELPDTISFK